MKISSKTLYSILLMLLIVATVIVTSNISKSKYRRKLNGHFTYITQIAQIAQEGLAKQLVTYDLYDEENKKLEVVRHGSINDGGYVIPKIAFEKADILLGYGIAGDIGFEEKFSDSYNKHSYGFDCGTESIEIKNPMCHFIRECIGSDKFINSDQTSSEKTSTYSEQLKKLGLENKKAFIKMDIEGAEYEAFEDIHKHASNITGIVLEIHFISLEQLMQASNLLSDLRNNFYLAHVHANNCETNNLFTSRFHEGKIPKLLEVTLVNKSLVHKAIAKKDQSHPTSEDAPNCPKNPDPQYRISLDHISK